ncbi:cytochrome c oxidase subunit I [Candidatus Palauibacter sp.]|uniref:cytochrome c oxidase subunit I n=1 Tax=Candidatus Palauibacter sp. TaxID=3101350 RepID=UPI003B5AE9C2
MTALAWLRSWLTTVDHKRIAVMYFVAAFLFLLIAGFEGQMLRLQLAAPGRAFLDPDLYNQLFTMHGTTMVFFAGMGLVAAFLNFVVPLQIGARDVAFPRLNALSFWVFLFGGLFLYASVPFRTMPDGGWFAYMPLTNPEYSPSLGMDFYLLALLIAGVGSIAGGVNFLVTILNLRAPGMTFMRMPLFAWMALIVAALILLAFPPFTVGLIFMLFDRRFGTHFFDAAAGADPVLWQHLFWVFGHPEVYILILPAFGVVSDVIPSFSRKGLFGYPIVVFSGILIAFLGFGVWVHHMFSVGLGPVVNAVFGGTTMLIAIPTGIKIFNWIATMWGGQLRFRTAMLFAIGLVGTFTIGGLSGVMHSSPPADLQQTDTYFVVAHFHYVLVGGTVFGLFSGFYYWFPKATGRLLHEGLGKAHFWLTFVALNVTFFPMHFSGLLGMPRRTYTYAEGLGLDTFNLISTIGAFIFTLAFVPLIWNLWRTWRRGEAAGHNPWDASTLEWTTPSPPPHYNFAVIPSVDRRDPLWHPYVEPELREEGDEPGGVFPRRQPDEPPEPVHMPEPSYWPLVLATGMLLMTIGGLGSLGLTLFGLLVTAVGLFGWAFEPPFGREAS